MKIIATRDEQLLLRSQCSKTNCNACVLKCFCGQGNITEFLLHINDLEKLSLRPLEAMLIQKGGNNEDNI